MNHPGYSSSYLNVGSSVQAIATALEEVRQIQKQLRKVQDELEVKILKLDIKHNKLRIPLWNRRTLLMKKIPNFWLVTTQNHPALCPYFHGDDFQILSYVESLHIEPCKNGLGSVFTVTFKENPFLENKELMKVYELAPNGTFSITSTKILWKDSRWAFNKDSVCGEAEMFLRQRKSFFSWFENCWNGDGQDKIITSLRKDIWPNPMKFFLPEVDEIEAESSEQSEAEDDSELADDSDEDGDEDYNDESGIDSLESSDEDVGSHSCDDHGGDYNSDEDDDFDIEGEEDEDEDEEEEDVDGMEWC